MNTALLLDMQQMIMSIYVNLLSKIFNQNLNRKGFGMYPLAVVSRLLTLFLV